MRYSLIAPLRSQCTRLCLGRCLAGALVLALFLWGALLPAALAQEVRTLEIRNGTVSVDGRPLSNDQLPDGLNVKGMNAQYRFLGIHHPVIELDDHLFAVEEDRLRRVTEAEVRGKRASVVLRGGRTQSTDPRAVPDTPETAQRQYLNSVQRSSRELYERLVRERRMEQNARELGRAIRLLPEGRERRAKIDTLHAMLEEIFELKQENRGREIERLQRQIRKLQESIQKREQMRDRMIERRLRQLIDSTQGK